MLPSNLELINHILDEVNFIISQSSEITSEQLRIDPVLSRAVIRSLEIVGEASSKLDEEFKANYPHIEWKKIINTRHRLIHNYFGVDYDIVWDIIKNKLPDFKSFLEEIIT